MKSRRSLLVLGIVIALMLSAVAVASAHAARSKAEFSASAHVVGLGAGDDFSTSVHVKYKGRGALRHIDKIVIKTVDEAVFTGPTSVDSLGAGCEESGVPGACDATFDLLDGDSILSLHDSRAALSLLIPPFDLGAVNDQLAGIEGYFGVLDGRLRGSFSIGPLLGTAKLNIGGTATYACFTDAGFPRPDVGYCSKGGDDFDPDNVFVPIQLNVVDTGSFKINPKPGEAPAGDRELDRLKGNLVVTIDAPSSTGFPPFGMIEITDAKAVYSALPHEHDDHGKKKRGKKKHDD